MLIRIAVEEYKILCQIERSAKDESESDDGVEGDTASDERLPTPVDDPNQGNERDEIHRHLGADGTECMGEALFCEELRHEHNKEG